MKNRIRLASLILVFFCVACSTGQTKTSVAARSNGSPIRQLASPNQSWPVGTTDGKTVQVTSDALWAAYHSMVTSTVNLTSKNDDGSTGFVNPSIFLDSDMYAVGLTGDSGIDYASGFCKLKGFSALVTSEGDGDATWNGPTVELNTDGTIAHTFVSAPGNVFKFRSIACK
jgi:hypothetical protein